ncbi:MAG: hypothetical protein IPM73_09115 [Betaproteobacteria bacterium]|nr:hypothetical protein [Betaproteobacteria bacterium]
MAYNLTGNALDNILIGNAAANTLVGGTGNDTLDGGAGNDILQGGLGDDTYTIDVLTDTVTEVAEEGTDLVKVSIATAGGGYVLGANLENGTLINAVAYNLTGNALDNVLIGNAAANVLNGGAGADTLVGSAGNDTYVVDNDGDVVIESSTVGTEIDVVQSSVNYTLGSNVENLTLTGGVDLVGIGNALNNTITGNTGNNALDGGAGVDTLVGGAGNDAYVVDLTATNGLQDTVTEVAGGGVDTLVLRGGTVLSTVATVTLGAEVDNLDAVGTGSVLLNLTGNALNNVLTGNAAANVLNGGAGADTLVGGAGNDTYVLDNAGDSVIENVEEGIDLIQVGLATAGGSYALGANLENGTLTNTVAYNLTGNALDNILIGNAAANTLVGGTGNDTLDGGAGNDILQGGLGDDTYTIDVLTDTVTEVAEEGTDLVKVSIATAGGGYVLGANLENGTLINAVAYNLTGNALDNVLIGNAAASVLNGGVGNDTLDGKAGSDTLMGGTGDDTYVIGRGYGNDTASENDATVGNTDVVQFLNGISTDQIWLRHTGNNLEVSVIGTTDKLTIENWYTSSTYHVEQLTVGDGKVLLDTQVEVLVQAMAAFAPPAAGQTTLPQNYQDALAPVIAANWQ